MLLRRTTMTAVAMIAVMIGAAACGGEDEPGPSADPTTSESPTEPTEPTSTEPPWEDKYTDNQVDAYEAALARWEDYENRSEPIWAGGKATDRAEALFKQYFPSPLWQTYFSRLESYEAADAQVEGIADVYWSKAKSISKDGRSVVIDQCVDYTPIVSRQNGEKTGRPKWALKPNLRTIHVSRPKGSDWLIYNVVDASSGKARPCEP